MIRKIKTRYRSPITGEWAILECGHAVQLSELRTSSIDILIHYNYNVTGLVCPQCSDALLLPDTLKEIWERYWHGRKAARF